MSEDVSKLNYDKTQFAREESKLTISKQRIRNEEEREELNFQIMFALELFFSLLKLKNIQGEKTNILIYFRFSFVRGIEAIL